MLDAQALAVIGGAIALAGGVAGSSIGMGIAGSAGTATLSEDPAQFRNVIVLAALPMTQSFYGLIVLILILSRVVDKIAAMPAPGGVGWAVLGCGLFAAAAEFGSAWYQGSVCASGISLLPKTKGQIFTNTMILAVYVELIGVLGLVFTILALSIMGLF
jgi:V/A-type H+-transporting ATPase subunit K